MGANAFRDQLGSSKGSLLADDDTWQAAHAAAAESLRAQLVRSQERKASLVPAPHGFVGRLLSIPLAWKLIGANGVLVFGAIIAVMFAHAETLPILLLALVASVAVNHWLVTVALRPLVELEATATRVWQGDFDARVAFSPVADSEMRRVGSTLNLLLDGLTADRARMRLLATQVINAQDLERARVARELHDSIAQTLAAASLQVTAALRQADGQHAMTDRLDELKALVASAMEETRTLSHTIHPRVLEDLGLVSALEYLARTHRQEDLLDVQVEAGAGVEEIPTATASVLYRVAQESVRNAVQHAGAHEIRILLDATPDAATLSVIDDGVGFDVGSAEARRPGMGLFSIRERVSLVDGKVEIQSAPGRGTRVTATVPVRH